MFKHIRLIAFYCILMWLIGIPPVHAAWVADGVAVCTVNNDQYLPVSAPDGSGGAIIVWQDDRTITSDIYAQRVDADGNILWMATAMPICRAPNSQSKPLIIPNGTAGAIIVWQDFRSGSTADIYAQKINSDGYIQWSSNGVAICTGQTGVALSEIISDGAGGAIIVWHDRRNFSNDVFAQRIDSYGTVQWKTNGVAITAIAAHQEYPSLASDGAGGAIIAWRDQRNGAPDIYAQRINAGGTVQWTADGIAVCDVGDTQIDPHAIPDGSGGAIIAWSDRRNAVDYDVYAQRVDASGNLQWGAFGVSISATASHQRYCRLIPCGSAEAIITWEDSRSFSTIDIYAQKIDGSGSSQWTSNGVAVCDAGGDQSNVRIISNEDGGAVISWEDERSGNVDIYAQCVNGSGAVVWTGNGEAICISTGDQTAPQLSPDGCGGAIIPWQDQRNGNFDIFTQRVDAAGHTVVATLLQSYVAAPGESGVEIEWTLSEAGEDLDFFIYRASEPSMIYHEIPSAGIGRDGLSFTYIDTGCEPATVYHYRVEARDENERKILFETGPVKTPEIALTLYQNFPNPFNPSTLIKYYVPERCSVSLAVYNVSGVTVKQLVDGYRDSGLHTVLWNGSNENGRQMSSGVYFYRLRVGKRMLSRKMLLLR